MAQDSISGILTEDSSARHTDCHFLSRDVDFVDKATVARCEVTLLTPSWPSGGQEGTLGSSGHEHRTTAVSSIQCLNMGLLVQAPILENKDLTQTLLHFSCVNQFGQN